MSHDVIEILEHEKKHDETEVGNYFVANYPPFSYWDAETAKTVRGLLDQPQKPGVPLGVYFHVPFCRKRCHFCYFRVYTDKNADEIKRYLDAGIAEFEIYARAPHIQGRKPRFVYFGGGTPSYLSVSQLKSLTDRMKALLPWDEAEEVTFEAEPGTLTEAKLAAIREIGVTRLSLGVENFDSHILEINGRAHRTDEIYRAYNYARSIGFPQINIDLISGMVEETDENWRENVRKTIELLPDSVTIYQMEVPYNTGIYKEMKAEGKLTAPVANWHTKRGWVDFAFSELEKAGYTVTSGYTAVRDPNKTKFIYRDALWSGADLIGLGVASFSHIAGTHFQNINEFSQYLEAIQRGELPISRAMRTTEEERMIREFILQMKLGRVSQKYFQEKFNVNVGERFRQEFDDLRARQLLSTQGDWLVLTREALLKVDTLLHAFFFAPTSRPSLRMIATTENELLYPLTLFWKRWGHALPAYDVLEGDVVPEPYRRLLVHHGDMTSRLEAFWGGEIVLEVLHRVHDPKTYRREVVLHIEATSLPVEYGAIEIDLSAFDEEVRRLILEQHLPLGGLLNRFGVRYRSEPKGFLKLGADALMQKVFGLPDAAEFYGRSNVLLGEGDRVLARIVEVVRPAETV